MANDKKFIVKNGLQTLENVVVGTTTDNGQKLQVSGTTKLSGQVEITQNDFSNPSLVVENTGGYLFSSPIVEFKGDSDSLTITNTGVGDYKLVNSQQNNGIIFYDSTPGVRILYNDSPRLDINSSGNRFYGLATTTIDNNRILTTADEGAGNGLDADTVDGLQGTQFVRSDVDDIMAGNYTIQQDLTIDGNLTVSGTTTTINTEEILLADNIIALNSNYTGSTPTQNSGIEIERGTLNNPKILWDEAQDYWKLISGTLTDLGRIITTADEGAGNGFDADTVDGLQASQFIRSDIDDTAAGNITIEGDLTIGDNAGPAQIFFDGNGINRTLYSAGGDIGFLNASFNYAVKFDSDGDAEIERDVEAGRNVIGATGVTATTGNVTASAGDVVAQNNVTATTGNVSATAGDVTAGDDVIAQNNVTATTGNVSATAGDVEAGRDVTADRNIVANDNITATTGDISASAGAVSAGTTVTGGTGVTATTGNVSATVGNVTAGDSMTAQNNITATTGDIAATAGNVTAGDSVTAQNDITATTGDISASAGAVSAATTVTAGTDVIGQRFVDAENNSYLLNPHGTSTLNDVGIDDDLFHNGDTDTRLRFETDNILLQTGGATRVDIDNSRVLSNLDIYAPNVRVNDSIIHVGDTDTKITFADDDISLQTGGATRLTANNSGVTVFGDLDVTGDISADSASFTGDVVAARFVDADDNNYFADPNNESVMHRIAIDDYIRHNGDTNTYFGFNANDNIIFNTAGGQRFEINATNVTSTVNGIFPNLYAARYYDNDNPTYYGDFASTSRVNDISLVGEIIHDGDSDTYIHFSGADTFNVVTGGATRLTIDTTYVTSTLDGIFPNLFAFRYYDAENATFYTEPADNSRMNDITLAGEIIADGDPDTYLQFHAANQFRVVTGGSERLEVSTYTRATGSVRSPLFYDLDNTDYYGNFASTSQMNRIDIDDYIRHRGDTDTYFGFVGNDNFRVVTGSSARLDITNTNSTFYSDVLADRFVDRNATSYFVHPGDGTLAAAFASGVRVGSVSNYSRYSDSTGTGGIALIGHRNVSSSSTTSLAISGLYETNAFALMYLNRIDAGPNPFAYGNRYIEFRTDGADDGAAFRGDSSGNFYLTPQASQHIGFWSSGGNEIAVALDDGNFVVGGSSVSYASMDNTPLVGSITNNKLHVNGSIQLTSNDDAIVFGRGTSTFLKDEELGFGWGGGLYMQDSTYLRIRNNKTVYSTGDIWASRFYAHLNQNYYVDPDGDSQLNTVDIDDYVRHRGDTNTYMGFNAADQIQFVTNADNRLQITNSVVRARNKLEVYGPGIELQSKVNGGGVGITMTDQNSGENPGLSGLQQASIKVFHSDNSVTSGAGLAMVFDSSVASTHYVFGESNGTVGATVIPRVNAQGNLGLPAYRWGNAYITSGDFVNLTVTNVIQAPGISGYANYLNSRDNRTIAPNEDTSSRLRFGFTSWNNNNTAPWADYLHLRSYGDATGGSDNLLMFKKSGLGMRLWQQSWNSGTAYSTFVDFPLYNVNPGTGNDFYADRFIDTGNTNYYADPASRSVFNQLTLGSTSSIVTNATLDIAGPIAVRGNQNLYFGVTTTNYNSWQSRIYNRTSGTLASDAQAFEWGNVGYSSGAARMFFDAANGVLQVTGDMRAPLFRDRDNPNYYLNPASTSILNTIEALRYYFNHGTNIYMDVATGNYGSVEVRGVRNSWAGYSIQGQWNFMSSGVSEAGIYNDTDNKWVSYFTRNGYIDLRYNGIVQAQTASGYFLGNNQIRAPIFYPTTTTSYYLDLDNGNTSQSLRIGGIIERAGFQASGDGNNNVLLRAQDYTHWIWQTATNWGIMWAGNTNPYRSHFSTGNPNEIVFIGSGNLRASIDLDNGNAYFQGTLSAGSFAINGGNEDLGLLKHYGSGLADFVLFDGSEYWDRRVTNVLQGSEAINIQTGDYVKSSDSPTASSYVVRTSGYRIWYSDYIAVEPGEEIYGEMAIKRISGSGGLFYYGIERFDKDKRAIAGNTGTTYFVASGQNETSTSWKTYRGFTTIPTSHTPYNGSDGGGVRFIRIRVLMNYNAGGALREFGPPILKRSNAQGRLRTEYDFYAPRLVDTDDNSFYVDPTGRSVINDVTVDRIDMNIMYDRSTASFYVDPGATTNLRYLKSNTNGSSSGTRALTIKDVGTTELNFGAYPGAWTSALQIQNNNNTDMIWISPLQDGSNARFRTGGSGLDFYTDGTSTNTGQRSLFVGSGYAAGEVSLRAPIFYDLPDTNYYVDPASTSRMNQQRLIHRLHIGDETNLYNGILEGTALNRPDLVIKGQYPQLNLMSTRISNGTHGPTLRFAAYDTSNASSGNFKHWVIGIAGTNATSLHFGYTPNQTNPHYGIGRGWSSGNNVSIMWIQNDRHVYAENDFRAQRFVDINADNYFVHPGDRSDLYDLRLRGHYARTYAHSGSDFTAGTLVTTSIPATATNGASFVLEATGKSYSGDPPFSFTAQGYLYANTIINYSGQHFGKPGFTTLYIFQSGGVLCFWWPRVSYWNSFAVHVRNANGDDRNLVTSITNSGLPSRTKEVQVAMKVTAVYNQNINVGDMYATRYYNSPNTDYYGDFDATSRMNEVSVNRLNVLGGGPLYFYTSAGNLRGYIRAEDTNDSHLNIATSGGEDIIFRDGGFGGTWNQIIRGNGQVLISGRLDVPVIYDRPDSSYRVDMASSSRLNTLEVVSTLTSNGQYYTNAPSDYWTTSITGLTNAPISTRNRDYNVGTTNRYLPLTHQTALYSSGYRTHLNTGLYKQASAWGDGSTGWYAAIGGNDSYPTQAWYLTYGGYIQNSLGYIRTSGSFRAPIYYDEPDSGRYLDLSGTSRFQRVEFYGRTQFRGRESDSAGSAAYGGGRISEYMSNVAAEFWSGNDQPVTLYFRSGVNAPSDHGYITFDPDYDGSGENAAMVIGVENDGLGSSDYIRLQGRTVIDSDAISSDNTTMLEVRYRNSLYSTINTDYLLHVSDIRSPIFYAYPNTNYYVRPDGTSQLHYVLANNWFRPQGNTGIYWQDYGRGIWAAESGGNSYGNVTTYGGGRNGWAGWGIGSRHVFMSTGGDNVGVHDNSRGWIWYWDGGHTRWRFGYNYFDGDVRSWRFYDHDTGYYGDFNSDTNWQGLTARGQAMIGLSGSDRSGARNNYGRRPFITGDTNYWTGAHGWSRVDMNTVADWGSGFFDSWSNPPNQPSGTSHWVGVQSYHYSNGSARYGWQIAGGPVDNLRFRNTWSSFRSWKTIPVHGVNNNSAGDLYAGRFVDAQDDRYWADPAGRSRLASIDYGNAGYYFRSGDWGWRHQTPYGWIQFGPANGSHAHIYTDRSNFYFNVNEMYMNGRSILKENYWNGSKYFGSDGAIYGTVFYDSNNDAFRWDGTSTNGTRMLGIHYESMAYQGLPGHTRNSGEYYRARPRQTGDTNYWTGAYGWGRVDMNVVSTWGSGFIDSWSNPPNQPAGTSHWVGCQAFHYRSSNTGGYGWQMVGGPITNLRFRSSWSGWRTWRTIPVMGENNNNVGGIYADVFYDNASPQYAMNLAATSRWVTSEQDGYHTFRNYGLGVTGTYTSTRLQQVFAMGSAYRLRSDGAATNNMYGIAWSHPNAGGLGGANQLNDHGMLIINNGSFRAAISSRAVFSESVRSPYFTDWTNSGYYLDPDSTSNSALRIRGGALHGPNPSWGEYLAVGTNGFWSGSYASVATTNGNLHLDSRSGRDLYLQWYIGRTVYINATVQDNGLRYYRSNTGMVIDIRSTGTTSRMGELVINDGVRLRSPNGNYGSFCIDGAARGGYEGFSIGDRVVMMHQNSSVAGIYNDVNNEWMMRFDLNSYCILYHNGSEKLRTRSDGIQAQGFYYSSDERLKENIVTIENAVDKVKKLRGVEYNWKDSGERDIGLIAQEVQEIVPEVVVIQDTSDAAEGTLVNEKPKDDPRAGLEDVLSIEYGHMVGLLVEAVKEQQEQIEDQKNEIEELKEMVNKLLKG